MVNNVILVGRIEKINDIVYPTENEHFVDVVIKLDHIDNKWKDDEHKSYYFVTSRLYGCVAENTLKYCKVNDAIGIRGRLEVQAVAEDYSGYNFKHETIVVAEKVTFLE